MDQDDVRKSRNADRGMGNENQGADGGERSEFRIPNSEFEQSLSSLMPRAARIDRDRLMFLAGQTAGQTASGGREPPGDPVEQFDIVQSLRSRAWPAAFAAMTALAASLLVLLVNRPEPRVIERIVHVPIEAPRTAATTPSSGEPDRDAVDSKAWTIDPREPRAYGESYLHARDQALAFGLDSWMQTRPGRASGEASQANYLQLRESLLQ